MKGVLHTCITELDTKWSEEIFPKTKKHVDKGKTLVRKLGQKIKVEDKKDIKLEEVPEPLKGNYEPHQSSLWQQFSLH